MAISKPKDADFNQASLKVTLPILAQTNIGTNPFGWMDPTTWATYGKWMKDNGELSSIALDEQSRIEPVA